MAVGTVLVVFVIGLTMIIRPTNSPGSTTPSGATVVPPFSKWVSFTSPDGRFAASFPGTPAHDSRPEKIGEVAVQTESFAFVLDNGRVTFRVDIVDYPVGSLSSRSPETIFANAERAFTTSGARVLASRDVSADHPGHEYTLTLAGEPSTVRAWIVGDRGYEVGAIGEASDTQSFLDSFRITAE